MNTEDFFTSDWIEELSLGEKNTTVSEEDRVEAVSPLLSPLIVPAEQISPLYIERASLSTTSKTETDRIKLLDFVPRHGSPGEPILLCMSSSNISKLSVWFDQETKRSEAKRITPQTWKCTLPINLEKGETNRIVTMRVHWLTSVTSGFPKGRYDFSERFDITVRYLRERVDTDRTPKNVLSRKRSRQDFKEADEDSDRMNSSTKNDINQHGKRIVSPPIVQRMERYRKSFATMIDEEDVELDTNKLSVEADRLFEDAFRFFATATSKRKEERKLFVNEAQRVDQTGLNLLHLMCLCVHDRIPFNHSHRKRATRTTHAS